MSENVLWESKVLLDLDVFSVKDYYLLMMLLIKALTAYTILESKYRCIYVSFFKNSLHQGSRSLK